MGPPCYEFILMSVMQIVELELLVFHSRKWGAILHSCVLFGTFYCF